MSQWWRLNFSLFKIVGKWTCSLLKHQVWLSCDFVEGLIKIVYYHLRPDIPVFLEKAESEKKPLKDKWSFFISYK